MTPSDEIGCKRIMLTDEWYPTLTEPNVELVDRPDRGGDAGRHPHADGAERAGRRDRARHRLRRHDFVAPMEIAGAGGRTLAEEWGDVPARTSA